MPRRFHICTGFCRIHAEPSLVLGSFSPESLAARQAPVHRPTSDHIWGSSWAHTRIGSPGRSRCKPLPPPPTFWPLGVIPRGTSSCAPKSQPCFTLNRNHPTTPQLSWALGSVTEATPPRQSEPTRTPHLSRSPAKPITTQGWEGEQLRSPES